MSLNILLIGNGGREHALAWKIAQSPLTRHIFCVPGNGGTATLQKVSNVAGEDATADNFQSLVSFAVQHKIDLVIPGPEQPLVDGVTDYFKEHGPARVAVFGPSQAAARMEGSKAFSKDFMDRHKIPTATYKTFTDHSVAQAFLDANKDMSVVIKASGLAAGKGVIIPQTHKEASEALASIMLDREFGSAGDSVVIEEYLDGEEISILSFSDGYTIRSLPAAQDHKRVNDNDEGPNTGGMGCYAPTSVASTEVIEEIHRNVLQPTIDGMRHERFPFVGCLFTGFMLTKKGPKVLEYNVRFGDPECQTLLPLLETDLVDILLACTNNYLSSVDFRITAGSAATVVVAAPGYPGKYPKNLEMLIEQPETNTVLFHAGTSMDSAADILKTSGGRVIASTSTGPNISAAVQNAYRGVSCIRFERMHYRHDIAYRELRRQKEQKPQTVETREALTYAGAGVSISSGNDLVTRIKPLVQRTARPGAGAVIGGFGGDINLADAGYHPDSPILVAAIDGIGTKILVARAVGNYKTVGIDLVAMNVNDLIVQGAEPLAFLDYYACSKLDVDAATDFVAGVAEGCLQGGCALIGGETAEMPSLYKVGDFDAAGCAIGAIGRGEKILPVKDDMKDGDVLLGLASNGCHSNGFSLVRKVVERAGIQYSDPAPWDNSRTVGEDLLSPTRIYVKSLLKVLRGGGGPGKTAARPCAIKGMAHITGGGLVENIPRMLPNDLVAQVEIGSWPIPSVFKWLKKEGALDHVEFAKTFNTGIGMVVVVGEDVVDQVIRTLQDDAEIVYRIGKLIRRRDPQQEGCLLNNVSMWDDL